MLQEGAQERYMQMFNPLKKMGLEGRVSHWGEKVKWDGKTVWLDKRWIKIPIDDAFHYGKRVSTEIATEELRKDGWLDYDFDQAV
jgi:hypothetical protein